jgi:DNA invertase Pin-like site-specific DNA recombinase
MRVAVYARVSTTRQAQAQGIEQQLDRLRAAAAERGWELDGQHVYRDDGYSGASLGRPGLDRLRDHAAMAGLDVVLVTAPGRLARNYVHQVLLIDELAGHGCQVEFLGRPMSAGPHDQLLLQIRGAVAEYERTLIAERMRRGRQAKLRAGTLLPWTTAPFGYRLDPERPRRADAVRTGPGEAALVAQLFDWYLESRATICQLTRRLTDLGVPTPRGGSRWNVASVRGILRNPSYAGRALSGRTQVAPARGRKSAMMLPAGPGPFCQLRKDHLDSPPGDGCLDQFRQRHRGRCPAQVAADGAGVTVPAQEEDSVSVVLSFGGVIGRDLDHGPVVVLGPLGSRAGAHPLPHSWLDQERCLFHGEVPAGGQRHPVVRADGHDIAGAAFPDALAQVKAAVDLMGGGGPAGPDPVLDDGLGLRDRQVRLGRERQAPRDARFLPAGGILRPAPGHAGAGPGPALPGRGHQRGEHPGHAVLRLPGHPAMPRGGTGRARAPRQARGLANGQARAGLVITPGAGGLPRQAGQHVPSLLP